MANLMTSSVLTMGGGGGVFAMPWLYTEILPRGGGAIWGMDKRGGGVPGGSSMVSCEVLHSRIRPPPPPPPLNTAMHAIPFVPNSH